jgi:hypothetical protein
MCVQPLRLDAQVFEKLLTKSVKTSALESLLDNNEFTVEWLKEFSSHQRKFRSYKPLLSEGDRVISNHLLVDDLTKVSFFVDGNHDISLYLDTQKTTFDFVFDLRFFSFVIVYELHFDFPEDILSTLLDTSLEHDSPFDLYNTLRNLMVRENNDRIIGGWAESIHQLALGKLTQLLYQTCNIKRNSNQGIVASIGSNTGNITLFVDEEPSNGTLKKRLFTCNANAERSRDNMSQVVDNERVSYAFFGRFHTIISKDNKHYLRYAPIQYHIQYMWFYVSYFSEQMDRLNNAILTNSNKKSLNEKRQIIDEYINKIELLVMNNESFKIAIESDSHIYQKVANKWNIESSLSNAKAYISFFKGYLERTYSRKAELAARKQNHILFFISCIQLLGIVSIWSDYLGLSKISEFVKKTGIQVNSTSQAILQINTWLPIGLFAIVMTLLLFTYGYRKK